MKPTPFFFLPLCALFLGACAEKGQIAITPAPQRLTADARGHAATELTVSVPRRAIGRRSRLVVTPTVTLQSGQTEELTPLVVDATLYDKKLLRRQVLEGYADPYALRALHLGKGEALTLPLPLSIDLPKGQSAAVSAIVSEDGCGACTSLDTILLAQVEPYREPPVEVVKKEKTRRKVIVRRPKRKQRLRVEHGEGVAHLQFIINRYDIRPELAHNEAELDKMADALRPILADTTAQIHSITISGVASVDGSLAFNTTLSLNRAKSARKWLCDNLQLCEEQAALISIASHPEGWGPVVEAMEAARHPWAGRVRAVVEAHATESDDVAERIIRRMACWPDIRAHYLQPDRKVTYTYSWSHAGVMEEYDDYDDMEETETWVENEE